MSGTFELEGFEPISRIGGGGFGDVWLARQTNVDRQVAIKVGHSPIQDETIRLRFDRECKALGRLSGHPNIIDVYTAGSLKDGRPYLVLEYINGGTLWQRLKRSPLPEDELISIGSQLAGALNEAHSSGVLHRDLKPENILIRSSGEAVLGDFGIARLQDGAHTTSAAITASVAYAAPEILSGKRATVASDLYGVGICLLAAVFRSVPFVQKTDDSIHPIINRVLTTRHPDVRRHGISEGLASIIDSLLEKDPARRPASAAQLQARIDTLRTQRTVSPTDATQVVPAGPPAPAGPGEPPRPPSAMSPPGSAPPPGPGAAPPPPPRRPPARPAVAAAAHDRYRDVDRRRVSPAYELVRKPPSDLRLFALAYVATLVVGGLLLLLAFQLFGGDGGNEGAGNGSAGLSAGRNALGEPFAASVRLDVPLLAGDVSFGATATVDDQSPGPGEPTLCNNRPSTDGLVGWRGRSISSDNGTRRLYQTLSRFETAARARNHLEAYDAVRDCDSWEVPLTGDPSRSVVYTAVEALAPGYGTGARRFDITGEIGGQPAVHARILLIQQDTDVLSLSITGASLTAVDELNELVRQAVDRLGYTTS
jgi:hypothetical protein